MVRAWPRAEWQALSLPSKGEKVGHAIANHRILRQKACAVRVGALGRDQDIAANHGMKRCQDIPVQAQTNIRQRCKFDEVTLMALGEDVDHRIWIQSFDLAEYRQMLLVRSISAFESASAVDITSSYMHTNINPVCGESDIGFGLLIVFRSQSLAKRVSVKRLGLA